MNRWPALFGLVGALAAAAQIQPTAASVTLIVAGNTLGYLSPCGCTEPMSGGILREGAAIRAIQARGPSVLLYTGSMVSDDSAQEVLKAEALAQALGSWGAAACNLTSQDAKLPEGELLNLSRLEGGRLISGAISSSPSNPLPASIDVGGFHIFGASVDAVLVARRLGEAPRSIGATVDEGLAAAKASGLTPILLLDGDRQVAAAIAKANQELKVIAYNSTGRPPLKVERVGNTFLVTPGEHGQYLVTLALGAKTPYEATLLTPAYSDDPETARFYKTYLHRLTRQDLWARTPRIKGPAFAGSESCASCHREAYAVWKQSAHAKAFHTVDNEGHGWDPECLPCHVVGARYRSGFQSLSASPLLASVGCESCHGSGVRHVQSPKRVRLPKVSAESCALSCHQPLNSPDFDFETYWAKIKHRLVNHRQTEGVEGASPFKKKANPLKYPQSHFSPIGKKAISGTLSELLKFGENPR